MSSKNSQNMDQSVPNNPDEQHPTPEPFTSPENPNNPKSCLPLAALSGVFSEVYRKIFCVKWL